ncbi:maleylacetoacetate isomerase [Antarcticimicrobium sediminis]|uniref:Maleylacetoacetate isomerase n=1 Tax=Antarcticimicrobium sediminis TaxID=2546227 RepID=A0A4V2Z7R1_9RHOB|nr:maleylacetoacetate isomerase [Antarcticimicrobium sediminis]TDE37446.1 maleylacetoacetate isomerase [Antarcticimicrobium sediminis]
MSEVVLYDFWRSSAAYRMRIALNMAGIAYTSVPVDLTTKQHKTPEHMARNPQGLVPVLEIDGLRLTQSLAMLDYLDITRAMGLLPKEPGARAQQMAVAHAIALDIHPVCNLQVINYAAEITGNREKVREDWMQRFIRPGLEAVEEMLGAFEQAPYACGPTPGLVDICLMPQLYNAHRWAVDVSDLKRICAIEAACAENPAFAAAYPDLHKPG